MRGDQGTSLSSLKKHRYVLEVSERQDHEISLQNIQGPLDQSYKGLKFGLLFPFLREVMKQQLITTNSVIHHESSLGSLVAQD